MNEFTLKPKSPFNGFVNYFTKRTDVFQYFSAEGEKHSSSWGEASTVLNYSIDCNGASCQWASYYTLNKSYIVFTFACPIYLTHYTLRTRTDASGNTPVSWTVECSRDGITWELVDTKENRT